MTKREAIRQTNQIWTLEELGFTRQEAESLRRISLTLRRWYERECGTDGGCIERDETTDKPYWLNAYTMRRTRIPDREKGAQKRLLGIINARAARTGHCDITAYLQTDPRGAALYILRPGDVPEGKDPSAYYTRGLCVY